MPTSSGGTGGEGNAVAGTPAVLADSESDECTDQSDGERADEDERAPMSGDGELVLAAVDSGVCTLTLHRPERRNAWNVAMEERYFACLDAADADPSVRAIVVTGAGTTFCPGLDTQDLAATSAGGRARPRHAGVRRRTRSGSASR